MPSTKVQLTGGVFQDAEGNVLANGYLVFQLSQDGAVSGVGNICAGVEVTIKLNSSGAISVSPLQYIWGNDQMSPINTYYRVTGYTAQGQPAWGPNNQQVTGNGGTFDVGTWVPNEVFSWTPPPSSIALETNGTPNGAQNILDLTAGTNVTITDNGSGTLTIASATASGVALKVNGTPNVSQAVLNLQDGSNIAITDLGSGNISIASTVPPPPTPPQASPLPDRGFFGIVTPGSTGSGINTGGNVGDGVFITSSGAGIASTPTTNDPDALRGTNWRLTGTGSGASGFSTFGGRSIIRGNRVTQWMTRWSPGPTQVGSNFNVLSGLSSGPTAMNGSNTGIPTGQSAMCFVYSPSLSVNWRLFTCDGTTATNVISSIPVSSSPQKLEIIFTPGVSADFYIDGVLAGSIGTTLPLSTVNMAWFNMINPYGNGAVADDYFEWVYWQQLY